jgi:hypothetical protein
MARGVDFQLGGVARHATRAKRAAGSVERVLTRATATVVRRLGPEAAREIARSVLNLPASKISRHVKVTRGKAGGDEFVRVSANKVRLPLTDFRPTFSRADGVRVQTWRDSEPQRLPHAFKRKDKPGAWQRVPQRGGGLVPRLPIVQRKGPSLHRVFQQRGRFAGHGDISAHLSRFTQTTLAVEIARLLRTEAT